MSAVYTIEDGVRRYRAMSLDPRPVAGVPDGSTWYEKDTEARFMFDEESQTWYPQRAGGSGGGDYVLPVATEAQLGGIKASDSVTVDPDGTAHAVGGEPASDAEVEEMLNRIFGDEPVNE